MGGARACAAVAVVGCVVCGGWVGVLVRGGVEWAGGGVWGGGGGRAVWWWSVRGVAGGVGGGVCWGAVGGCRPGGRLRWGGWWLGMILFKCLFFECSAVPPGALTIIHLS